MSDIISKSGIEGFLLEDLKNKLNIAVVEKTESTNLLLKNMAANGAEEGAVIIAGEQTGGIGRMGRSFFSPGNTGIYMSLLLKPDIEPEKSVFITTAAAVAVCRGLEKNGVKNAGIKWVNDIYVNGKKVCGILTQGSVMPDVKRLGFAILGIGLNVYQPQEGFPEEIKNIAASVFEESRDGMRNKLVADILTAFYGIYDSFNEDSYVEEYIKRSVITGKKVDILVGNSVKSALVKGIDKACRILVQYEDGSCEALDSGEVSIRLE